jgi:RNA polymerase sigma factor (sigma-70 family)
MAGADLGSVLRHLQQLAEAPAGGQPTDRELLDRFRAGGDETAFTALVRRHGRLVAGVCRHVLHHEQDAEDAVQATFLILARRADRVRKPEALASWLHSVAYRVAQTAQRTAARQRARERQIMTKPGQDTASGLALRELQKILDEEIQRLPKNQRAPFVLCFLEGHSRAEAARELGWKEGTVSSRVARARKLLQSRLARRGVSLSAALSAGALADKASAAIVPVGALVRAALPGAAAGPAAAPRAVALADAVMKAMSAGRVVVGAVVVLALSVFAAGAGALILPPQRKLTAPPAVPSEPDRAPSAGRTTDRQGDPLPPGAVARLGTIRLRHGGAITCFTFGPRGKYLASGGHDRTVAVWDAATGREWARLTGHQSGVEAVAFSADGRLLASGGGGPYNKGSEKQMIRVWDLRTKKQLIGFGRPGTSVRRLVFSHDNKTLASAGDDRRVALWEVATGKILQTLSGMGNPIRLALSPDARRAALAYADRTVTVWDLASGKEMSRLKQPSSEVAALAFGPDGKLLAVAGADGGVRLWDAATGMPWGRCPDVGRGVVDVAFLRDGKCLAAWGDATPPRLWDLASGKLVGALPNGPALVAFAPDGERAATSRVGEALELWATPMGKALTNRRAHQAAISSVALCGDERAVVTYSANERLVRRWDLAAGAPMGWLAVAAAGESVNGVAVAPDGKLLAAAGHTWARQTGIQPVLYVADATTGRRRFVLKGHRSWLQTVAFSPDGKTLASGGDDDRVLLWATATGKQILCLGGHRGPVGALAFSPDGRVLASVTNRTIEHCLRLWDPATGALLHRIERGYCDTSSVAFSPDGRMVATGSGEQPVSLWEVATGQKRFTFAKQRGWWVRCVAFSPDGKYIAVGVDRNAYLWDLLTGKEVRRFTGHRGAVTSLVFGPNGKTLISGSDDTTALVWDVGGAVPRPRPLVNRLEASRAETLWANLASPDAARAYLAVRTLALTPSPAVAMLREHLRPVRLPDRREEVHIARWIAELDHDRYSVRQKAVRELERLGDTARPALLRALASRPSAEARRQLERLLGKRARAANVQQLRALEVLERAGTTEARRVLQALGQGAAGACLTQEARAALSRLAPRSQNPSRRAAGLVPAG